MGRWRLFLHGRSKVSPNPGNPFVPQRMLPFSTQGLRIKDYVFLTMRSSSPLALLYAVLRPLSDWKAEGGAG